MKMRLNNKGVTFIEILIVFVIVGLMLTFGVVGINTFFSKNKVRRAATDLLQNMRLARTMAIKENRVYRIIMDYNNQAYYVGFDGNADGDLLDADDGFGTGSVKMIAINRYGDKIVLGSNKFSVTPPNGPNGTTISNAVSFTFNPDGSAGGPGSVYIQQTTRGYTYCVRLSNAAGKIDLYIWNGDKNNQNVVSWSEIR